MRSADRPVVEAVSRDYEDESAAELEEGTPDPDEGRRDSKVRTRAPL